MELELFEKTEIWIRPIQTHKVNLSLIAEKAAAILNLEKKEVMVVDVREDIITLDVLKKTVRAEDIIGKEKALLRGLAEVPGVSITPETTIHSEGILGLIAVEDQKVAKSLLRKTERMGREIFDRIKKRVLIFPSGLEIQKGLIQDTNSPYIKHRLTQEGFEVTIGNALDDDPESIASVLNRALNEGFGLVVTTGGVGAEDKDRTIEALLKLDPKASTPYITRYQKGTGRHQKDGGVRVGVAYLPPIFIVALPGPHEEVKIGIETIIEGLKKGLDKESLALSLSEKYIKSLKNIHQPAP